MFIIPTRGSKSVIAKLGNVMRRNQTEHVLSKKTNTKNPPEILITSLFTWEHFLELDLFKFKLDYLNPSDPKICVTANKTIGTEEPG